MEKEKFKDFLVIPDVLDAPPQEICDVVFHSGAKAVLGNELQAEDVCKKPARISWSASESALYTLIIADIDTQEPEKNEGILQWQQYVVVNIPGNNIEKGDVLTEYMGSGPLPNTGLHRYAVLVWKQSGRITPKEPHYGPRDDVRDFSIRDFVQKYHLQRPPVAANFYQTKYDDSVRELYYKTNLEKTQKHQTHDRSSPLTAG